MQNFGQTITLTILIMIKKVLLAAIVAIAMVSCGSSRKSQDISSELEHGRMVNNYVKEFLAD